MTRDERLLRLEGISTKIIERVDTLLNELGEANLRIRYLMECGRIEKPASEIIAGGSRLVTFYEDYMLEGGRERILDQMHTEKVAFERMLAEEQEKHAQAAGARGGAPAPQDDNADDASDTGATERSNVSKFPSH